MRIVTKPVRFLSPAKSDPRRPGLPLRAAALAAFVPAAVFGAFALMPSAAMAEAEPCVNNVLCDNAGEALRDDLTEPPAGVEGHDPNYGTDAMATNTEGALRLIAIEKEGEEKAVAANANPPNYAYFGVELERNPETSTTACEEATGSVTFADIQNATPSPVFSGVAPEIEEKEGKRIVTSFGPWPISVRSDHCDENPGKVTVTNVHLFFPKLLEAVATGEFTGHYLQPGEENAFGDSCEAGGLDLDQEQPGVTVVAKIGETAVEFDARIDNGNAEDALLCFVSANNYLFPEPDSEGNGPSWEPLEGAIWKD